MQGAALRQTAIGDANANGHASFEGASEDASVTDYERAMYRDEIQKLLSEVARLQAQIVELTARLLDEEAE